ncbi:MAG: class I SAM-dependent methyltransferase [Candidatus Binataceae bacterium]
MRKAIRPIHLALGIHGLALLRTYAHDEPLAQSIARKLADFAAAMENHPGNVPVAINETDVREGYAAWSATYDLPGNPLISAEEPVVHAMIDTIAPGRALDAACGTGRHTKYLAGKGFDTTGIDCSPEMLELARVKVPEARFELGDLTAIPFATGSFDLALCALALDHADDLLTPIAELARVVRPGGRVIISMIHPIGRQLGGGAFYRDADGARGIVRGPEQSVSDYIMAAVNAGLEIRQCVEPVWGEREIAMLEGKRGRRTELTSSALDPEIFRIAILDSPCALVLNLAKPAILR